MGVGRKMNFFDLNLADIEKSCNFAAQNFNEYTIYMMMNNLYNKQLLTMAARNRNRHGLLLA